MVKNKLDLQEIISRQEFAGAAIFTILLLPSFLGLLAIAEYCEKGSTNIDKGTVLFFSIFLIPLVPFVIRFIWYSIKRYKISKKWWPLW